MSYNLSSSHQIIPNAQQYMLHYKFVTINSDDLKLIVLKIT